MSPAKYPPPEQIPSAERQRILYVQAVKEIDLAVAYASWGAIGILGTAIGGSLLFKQKLKPIGWIGIAVVIAAVVVMKTA